VYDFSDLDDEELELIALEGGERLARLRTRADAAQKAGRFDDYARWGSLVQAEVDAICVRFGIKGGELDV
jgi:hypothetical protein